VLGKVQGSQLNHITSYHKERADLEGAVKLCETGLALMTMPRSLDSAASSWTRHDERPLCADTGSLDSPRWGVVVA
jgi:hypothetical protein